MQRNNCIQPGGCTMKAEILVFVALTAVLLLVSVSVFAHHSNALSDKERLTTMTGTGTKCAFTNPHVGISLDVKDAQGHVVNWYAFGGNPVALHREGGWTNKTFKVGEQILVRGHVRGFASQLLCLPYCCCWPSCPWSLLRRPRGRVPRCARRIVNRIFPDSGK